MTTFTCPHCPRTFINEMQRADHVWQTHHLPDWGHHIDKGPGATHYKGDDCEIHATEISVASEADESETPDDPVEAEDFLEREAILADLYWARENDKGYVEAIRIAWDGILARERRLVAEAHSQGWNEAVSVQGDALKEAWAAAYRLGREDASKVTRFEVIDHRASTEEKGRVIVKYGVNVKLSFQDDDRTLKVFLTDKTQEQDSQ